MNVNKHFVISMVKSILRIGSCVLSCVFNSVYLLAIGFGVAEILGIFEEIYDNR